MKRLLRFRRPGDLESNVACKIIQKTPENMKQTNCVRRTARRTLIFKPLRPVVDRAVLEFVLSESFAPKDFVLRSDGVCRLSPQLARVLAGQISEAVVECPLDL